MSTFAKWRAGKPCRVWDVGANKGQWAFAARELLPQAAITSFEIVPGIADTLNELAKDCNWWSVERLGLSDRPGTIAVTWNKTHDLTSSITPVTDSRWFTNAQTEQVMCPVTTLDLYSEQIGYVPTLLKIDVEGHEAAVLEGGSALLSGSSAPAMIQFEYGSTWFGAQRMLGPVQRRLECFGYVVGRLYPDHVDFHPFSEADEHFRMGNMIAARDLALRQLLAGL